MEKTDELRHCGRHRQKVQQFGTKLLSVFVIGRDVHDCVVRFTFEEVLSD